MPQISMDEILAVAMDEPKLEKAFHKGKFEKVGRLLIVNALEHLASLGVTFEDEASGLEFIEDLKTAFTDFVITQGILQGHVEVYGMDENGEMLYSTT